jgi:hypothetical protein
MLKQFYSTFAPSLLLLSLGSVAQESPGLQQKSGSLVKTQLDEREVELPKGQRRSLIKWENLDPDEWSDIQRWINERTLKDEIPDWKLRLRQGHQVQGLGRILHCQGECEVHRAHLKISPQYLSRIQEGDELRTGVNSSGWLFLFDGTLLRIGPKSSVTLQEISWSDKEVLHLIRLNQGHVFWHPRENGDHPKDFSPQTDAISLPIRLREANQQWFERNVYQDQSDQLRQLEIGSLEEKAINLQIQKINQLRQLRSQNPLPASKVMMVAPNATIVAHNQSLDFLYYPGGRAFFRARSSGELKLSLRGYLDTDIHLVSEMNWFEVDPVGRQWKKIQNPEGKLEITELITRRIRTMELARELWINNYTIPIVNDLANPQKMAQDHGILTWPGAQQLERYNFLQEYTRRIETTQLRSLQNLLTKMGHEGDKFSKELNDDHYQAAIKSYLLQLKQRYGDTQQRVREMSDLEYYAWILRHGKKKN